MEDNIQSSIVMTVAGTLPEEQTVRLRVGRVPLDVIQRWLDGMNQVIDAGQGFVETEVRARRAFIRPQPSYEHTLAE